MTDRVVRHALATDEHEAARVLAEAFSTDPVMEWLFTDADTSPNAMLDFFSVVTATYRPHGHTYVVGGDGVAVWSPPDMEADLSSLGRVVRRHLDPSRHNHVFDRFARLAEHHPTEPHFYLQAIGVRSDRQGRGIGSRLLRHALDTCDRTGLTAYLESSNPTNLSLYRRHGFEVTAEIDFARGVVVRPMERRPER